MKRILPFPLMSMAIAVMWMLLTGFSSGHVVLALLVGFLVPRVMLLLEPAPPNIRFGMAMPKLAGRVIVDIFRSNYAVWRIILFDPPGRKAGFIEVSVQLTSPYALAVLGIILTATPGTLWVQHDAKRRRLLLHVLDLIDEAEWNRLIRERYESLLMEIFE